ncbi:hypothetical protein [Pseudomonas sp.]|uniref:hypothetical protein n=1 Tax=Pseudomonas sp. TaxID=306 RepID=UPI003D0AE966
MADLTQQARELANACEQRAQWGRGSAWNPPRDSVGTSCLLDEAASLIRGLAALRAAPEWQPMETAPRDGTAVLVAIDGSDIPQPCRFRERVGWVIAWDEWRIPAHDGPLGWMPLPVAARSPGVNRG